MSRTTIAGAMLLALLAGCSLEGIWLQPRSNPHDLYYPPEVVQVYAGNLDTPLVSGSELSANTTPLIIEFNMIMDQASTGTATGVVERYNSTNTLPNTLTWLNDYTLQVAPDPTWPAGIEAALLVLDDAANANEVPIAAAFTTYFLSP